MENILEDIENYLDNSIEFPNKYEELPKCLIPYIDIGTYIRIKKNDDIYLGGKLIAFNDNELIINNRYNKYVKVNFIEYRIFIYNKEMKL